MLWLSLLTKQIRGQEPRVNPFAAELLPFVSHSVEAGIALAVSSFKWMKKMYIIEKWTSVKSNY